MLESIRKSTKSIYILFIFGAIILVFVFWGIGPMGKGAGTDEVASVDGTSITVKEYTSLHKRVVDYYRNLYKERFTPAMERELNIKNEVVGILINRALAVNEARAEGMKVTKADIQDTIAAIPAFQKDGVFDRGLYFENIKAQRMKPADFEDAVRRDLLAERVRVKVTEGISVTDTEIEDTFLRENRRINLKYISLDGGHFKGSVKVSDEDAKNYLKENTTDFIEPARVKVLYAHADYADFRKSVKVTDGEIKEYYDKNQDSLKLPGQLKARHILIRPDLKNPDKAAARDEAEKRAEELLKRIKAGEEFESLARKYSEDPGSAAKGGDLGWFPRGVMVKGFEDAAFALGKGSVSGVVETPFGFHIIKSEDRREPKARPLSAVRGEIIKTLKEEKARDAAAEAINSFSQSIKEAKGTAEVERAAKKARGVKYAITGFFTSAKPAAALSGVEGAIDNIFLLDDGEVGPPVKTHEGLFIVKLIKRIDARLPDYKEIAPKVKAVLIEKKAYRKAGDEAHKLLEALKGGAGISGLAKDAGYKLHETGYFAMTDGFIPTIGAESAPYREIFDLNKEDRLYKKVLEHNKKFYIFEWTGSKKADLKALTPEIRKMMRPRIKSIREDKAINKWLEGLRKKADIRVYKERL